MRKIKKGDQVIVRTGRDRGRMGVVLSVLEDGLKAIVEGINLVKRHTRGNPQQGKAGGIIEKETSIYISNLSIFNKSTQKADKVGFKFLEDGSKVRIYKSTGEVILESRD